MMQIDRVFQAQSRTRKPRAGRYFSSTALATLIAFGAAGAVSAQDITVTGSDTFTVNNGDTFGNLSMSGLAPIVTVDNLGTLTGDATVNRGTLTNNGLIGGGIDTTGGNATVTVNVGVNGRVFGPVNHSAGTLNSTGFLAGGVSVGNGATANINGGVVGNSTVGLGTLNISGGQVNGVTLNGGQNGGVVNNLSTISGPVTVNGGVFNTTNRIVGDVTTNGGETNARGNIFGNVTVNGGSSFTTTGTLFQHNGNLTNNGALNVSGGLMSVINGTVTNTGAISVANGRTLNYAGNMINSGNLGLGMGVPGATTVFFGGGVSGSGGSTLDMQNGAAGDRMVVNGGVSGTNTVAVNLDLTTTNAGFADVLDVNGQLNGDVTVNVDSVRGPLGYTLQQTPITVVNANSFGGNLATSLTGDLPQGPTGLVLYSILNDMANADVQVQSEINPAIGGVAAAFSSVQNIIGTVVNRPSGAYVSGIAFDTPDNCSTGVWGRVIGGRVNSDSATRNSLGTKVDSNGRLDYAGLQGGADFGCFEAFDGGWDISGGMLFGATTGEFLEKASGLRTVGTFDQYFLGGYVAAAKGNWSGEMQLRYGTTDYNLKNTDLAVLDEDTSVDSYGLSGSVTYRHQLAPGLALLPSIGFNVNETDSASIALTNGNGVRVGSLTVEDQTNLTGFVGATLSRTTVNEAAGSATNAFLTGTYYVDGSDDLDTTVRLGTGNNIATAGLKTSNIGDFAELSAGGSIVRLIGNGPGGVRQVNYSVRVDARYGEDLDGVGVTGQVRYQF